MEAGGPARDGHLFGPGPKRILAVDGGGVRGAIAVAFLARIEALLAERSGHPVRLCDHFDLAGGTSTGSLIALGVALGYSAAELRDMYLNLAPNVFRRSAWRLAGLHAKFDARALSREIQAIVGRRTLDSADLRTGFAVVTKRLDTGSTWVLSNNPHAPYWDSPADHSFIGNRHFLVANLVRASAAAPHYFDPELLPIVPGAPDGLFIDGGVSPHNNPALALFLMVRATAYGLQWPTGPQALHIVSIGTGSYRATLSPLQARRFGAAGLAVQALAGMIADSKQMVLTMMQWMGECPRPWQVNSEVGSLAEEVPGTEKLFRFLRYDIEVEAKWLHEELGLSFGERDIALLRELDNPRVLGRAYEIGARAAERQVKVEHLDFAAA